MEHENIIGMFGLCQRDGQIRNQQDLISTIKERKVFKYNITQFNDPKSDYIWVMVHEGEISQDEIELSEMVDCIMDDENRFW
mgnify:CR=1 FL=1|tara:strand:+ start:8832 stop:9077 length:246 start_codon:yes stop_codon:yes gene_type:complete